MKKVFEPITKSLENTSQNLTKAITESSRNNNKAIENINNKLLDIMKDKGILASYLMSPLPKITNLENTTQFKLVKDPNSKRVNDLKINKTKPNTLYKILLLFRDSNREFELTGDPLKMITNKNYNVDLASLSYKKSRYDFAKEMNSDVKTPGKESTRDRSPIKLFKSPRLLVSPSGVSKKIFASSDPDELCDRLKFLLQKKQAGNNSDIINQEIVAIVDKLIEYKCISKRQHKQILIKCNTLQEQIYLYVYMFYI